MPSTLAQGRKRTLSSQPCVPLIFSKPFSRRHSDPLVSHGRHFCRAVHALCNVKALLTNGILRLGELAEEPEEAFTAECALISNIYLVLLIHYGRERREHRVFGVLLQMVPGIESRLMNGDEDEVIHIADMVSIVVMSTVYSFTYLALLASERRFECSI